MKQSSYDFRQFQQELAELDRKNDTARQPVPPLEKVGVEERLAQAKAEFQGYESATA
ncbi:hypothetical protein [Dokdonella ginsengisoli]|uniref:Uncharacterized protein n=1 Tax=Dokdonella ginsengisoli TaxID=363846 RepID=A0ABV9QXZ3_9GAMM